MNTKRWIGRHERAYIRVGGGSMAHQAYCREKDEQEEKLFALAVEQFAGKEFFLERLPIKPCECFDALPNQYLIRRVDKRCGSVPFAEFYNPVNAINTVRILVENAAKFPRLV